MSKPTSGKPDISSSIPKDNCQTIEYPMKNESREKKPDSAMTAIRDCDTPGDRIGAIRCDGAEIGKLII
jgi:hypothetical protein